MGVWNVIQALGEKVCEDGAELIEAYKKGQVKGKRQEKEKQDKAGSLMTGGGRPVRIIMHWKIKW